MSSYIINFLWEPKKRYEKEKTCGVRLLLWDPMTQKVFSVNFLSDKFKGIPNSLAYFRGFCLPISIIAYYFQFAICFLEFDAKFTYYFA